MDVLRVLPSEFQAFLKPIVNRKQGMDLQVAVDGTRVAVSAHAA